MLLYICAVWAYPVAGHAGVSDTYKKYAFMAQEVKVVSGARGNPTVQWGGKTMSMQQIRDKYGEDGTAILWNKLDKENQIKVIKSYIGTFNAPVGFTRHFGPWAQRQFSETWQENTGYSKVVEAAADKRVGKALTEPILKARSVSTWPTAYHPILEKDGYWIQLNDQNRKIREYKSQLEQMIIILKRLEEKRIKGALLATQKFTAEQFASFFIGNISSTGTSQASQILANTVTTARSYLQGAYSKVTGDKPMAEVAISGEAVDTLWRAQHKAYMILFAEAENIARVIIAKGDSVKSLAKKCEEKVKQYEEEEKIKAAQRHAKSTEIGKEWNKKREQEMGKAIDQDYADVSKMKDDLLKNRNADETNEEKAARIQWEDGVLVEGRAALDRIGKLVRYDEVESKYKSGLNKIISQLGTNELLKNISYANYTVTGWGSYAMPYSILSGRDIKSLGCEEAKSLESIVQKRIPFYEDYHRFVLSLESDFNGAKNSFIREITAIDSDASAAWSANRAIIRKAEAIAATRPYSSGDWMGVYTYTKEADAYIKRYEWHWQILPDVFGKLDMQISDSLRGMQNSLAPLAKAYSDCVARIRPIHATFSNLEGNIDLAYSALGMAKTQYNKLARQLAGKEVTKRNGLYWAQEIRNDGISSKISAVGKLLGKKDFERAIELLEDIYQQTSCVNEQVRKIYSLSDALRYVKYIERVNFLKVFYGSGDSTLSEMHYLMKNGVLSGLKRETLSMPVAIISQNDFRPWAIGEFNVSRMLSGLMVIGSVIDFNEKFEANLKRQINGLKAGKTGQASLDHHKMISDFCRNLSGASSWLRGKHSKYSSGEMVYDVLTEENDKLITAYWNAYDAAMKLKQPQKDSGSKGPGGSGISGIATGGASYLFLESVLVNNVPFKDTTHVKDFSDGTVTISGLVRSGNILDKVVIGVDGEKFEADLENPAPYRKMFITAYNYDIPLKPDAIASVKVMAYLAGAGSGKSFRIITPGQSHEKIREMYQDFARAYQQRDSRSITRFLADDWEAADGTDLDDMEEILDNSFDVFDTVNMKITNLNVQKGYGEKFQATYTTEITGIIEDQDIRHHEKTSITDEVILTPKGPRITRTSGGAFWLR